MVKSPRITPPPPPVRFKQNSPVPVWTLEHRVHQTQKKRKLSEAADTGSAEALKTRGSNLITFFFLTQAGYSMCSVFHWKQTNVGFHILSSQHSCLWESHLANKYVFPHRKSDKVFLSGLL